MVTASPAVSPSVVARTLTIQNRKVTCGTLAMSSDFSSSIHVLRDTCCRLPDLLVYLGADCCREIARAKAHARRARAKNRRNFWPHTDWNMRTNSTKLGCAGAEISRCFLRT